MLGHSKPSTTLDLYTHYRRELEPRVGELFAEVLPSFEADGESEADEDDGEDAV